MSRSLPPWVQSEPRAKLGTVSPALVIMGDVVGNSTLMGGGCHGLCVDVIIRFVGYRLVPVSHEPSKSHPVGREWL